MTESLVDMHPKRPRVSMSSVAALLEFDQDHLVHFGSGTYCWVNVKQFTIDPGASDQELLAALLRHHQYHDHYAGEDPQTQDHHALHGPYRLERINVDTFRPVTCAGAQALIRSWADDLQSPSADVERILRQQVFPLLESDAVYQLPDIRETAEHDWGWVVGLGGFHEFAAIDRTASRLTLLVASDD